MLYKLGEQIVPENSESIYFLHKIAVVIGSIDLGERGRKNLTSWRKPLKEMREQRLEINIAFFDAGLSNGLILIEGERNLCLSVDSTNPNLSFIVKQGFLYQ